MNAASLTTPRSSRFDFDDDAEVIKFVSRHEGAIGYVSGNASLGGVKAVTIR